MTTIPVTLDPGATLPTRAHPHDAGLDLTTPQAVDLTPGALTEINTGIHIAIPAGHVGLVIIRSSIGTRGITLANQVGVIDSDYRGPIILSFYSKTWEHLQAGERIAQLLIIPCHLPIPVQVDALDQTERGDGGYGSTGR